MKAAEMTIEPSFERYAAFDLETRCNLALARQVLHLPLDTPAADVLSRLAERRRAEGHRSPEFLKLPFHEPVAGALLLAEPSGSGPTASLRATEWVTWAMGEEPAEVFVERAFVALAGRTSVGFNSSAFDLPLLALWASRCRLPLPAHFSTPLGAEGPGPGRHCDLQRELAGGGPGTGTFDELCKFHGLAGKPGICGGDVEALAQAGRLDEIQAYNVTDVLQTYLLFLHVLVRSGRLARATAAESCASAVDLTRAAVAQRLARGSQAHDVLSACLDACASAPIAQAA